ncbi:MAG: hypothetical protein JSV18_00555 [Candidatus Bathyarchaeota archaeon]|nr:MAG: hypothetical protein JSV18_00555 [Candidatus Bathyarchaeota archaeon]
MMLWILVILGILVALLLLGSAEAEEYVREEEPLEEEVLFLFDEEEDEELLEDEVLLLFDEEEEEELYEGDA